ncbi:MAG: LPS assembly protein LptD [Gammaproteobacteria bacterium]|nr:LPS assembly protein LptD [Gammaproteobacteria bacterium]
MPHQRPAAVVASSLLLLSLPAAAAPQWGLCEIPAAPPPKIEAIAPDTPIELAADEAYMNPAGTSVLLGDVRMWRSGQFLRADEVYYTQARDHIEALGNLRFEQDGLIVTGPAAELRLNTDNARFTAPEYEYTPRHARGAAASVDRKSPAIAVLDDATYTTCNPGDDDWLLSADRVALDRESGDGTARGAVLRFKNIPFFYTPWIRFPIDDRRKSGFLFPTIGTSSRSGFSLETPYYWNIAPDRDATMSPRLFTKRGLQLRSEFRYLNPSNDGEIELELLDDREANDQRYLAGIRHHGSPLPRVTTTIDARRVSDDQYFEDLGSSLSTTSTSHLQQRADASYQGDFWNAVGRVQAFQTVDDTLRPQADPYEQLPQILLEGGLPDRAFGLGYDLRTEWVNFAHDERVAGQRMDVDFGIERPVIGSAYFFNPEVSLRHTAYSLDETTALFTDDNITRTLPVTSLDSGLIFDRPIGGGDFVQTLEPRLFYLYAPFRAQDNIPTFDTGLLDFSFAQLFRENRFSGADRIGDANQLSLGLTSRFLNTGSGQQLLSASIGQILYFDEQAVTLPSQTAVDDDTSDLAAELALNLGERWSASAATLWDPQNDEVQRGTARLNYSGTDNRILNLSYRYRRADPQVPGLNETLRQTDIAVVWPLSPRWRALGRWNYDLEEQRDLELLAGFEYDSCCYKVRIAARRFIIGDQAEYNNGVEVQLILKGLAQLGSPLGELLERGILGYEDYD